MWIVVIMVVYFIIGLYIAATTALHMQYASHHTIKLNVWHKLVAVILGLLWIIFLPFLSARIIKDFWLEKRENKNRDN